MSILDTVKKPENRPIICTITGDAGMGKTRLAAAFPKPIFIRAEDGMQSIPIDVRPHAFPVLKSVDDLWRQFMALVNDKHDYETLVIDSVTQLDTLFTQYVVDTDEKGPRSIAQANGGYGAGFQAVSALHGRVRKAAGVLNIRKKMNIVFIAHSETTTIELPDAEPYTKYDIRMQKKSVTHYVDNVDLVGHVKLETFTVGDADKKKKKAISDGTRLLVCHASAAQVSKNRFGIIEPLIIPEGENPLSNVIDGSITTKKQTKPSVNEETIGDIDESENGLALDTSIADETQTQTKPE